MSNEPTPQAPADALEADGGNLYRHHPFMVNSGQFWRCAHGTTGFDGNMDFKGCMECAKADPTAFASWHRAAGGTSQAPAPASADCDECDALRMNLADLLTRTANALRGQPEPGRRWSWHDLPDRAAAAIAAIDVMQRTAASLAAESESFRQAVLDPENQPSQYGTVLLAPAADERAPLPPIKGACIDGGYVIVTPAGFGDTARPVRDAILRLFPVVGRTCASPLPADQGDTA